MIVSVLLAFSAQSASTRLPPARALPPPTANEQEVLAPIDGVLGALRVGDAAAMMRFVYAAGRVTATGTRSTSSGLRQQSWTEFAARVTPAMAFDETINDPAIEVDGDVAMVWAPYVVRVGGKIANCGIDHFDLVREAGAWKVMNLTFSSRTVGCPQ